MKQLDPIRNEKRKIRERVLFQLKSQSSEDRMFKGEAIRRKVLEDPAFQKAQHVMFYASDAYEVPTRELMAETLRLGKKVSLPRIDRAQGQINVFQIRNLEADLEKGSFGILEPRAVSERETVLNELDIVFTPGVAFDKAGNRLGRGLAYYDRFLKQLSSKTLKVGLAFDFQIVDRVPTLPGDVRLDRIISND